MEAVYPAAASALARGRRARRGGVRARHRTTPVTFAEIKEVDEEKEEEECAAETSAGERSRRRPDVVSERLGLGREFAEFRRRRRRARRDALPEPPDEPADALAPSSPAAPCSPAAPAGPAAPAPRAGSEPLEPR